MITSSLFLQRMPWWNWCQFCQGRWQCQIRQIRLIAVARLGLLCLWAAQMVNYQHERQTEATHGVVEGLRSENDSSVEVVDNVKSICMRLFVSDFFIFVFGLLKWSVVNMRGSQELLTVYWKSYDLMLALSKSLAILPSDCVSSSWAFLFLSYSFIGQPLAMRES